MYLTYGLLLGTGVGCVYSIAMFGIGIWWPDAKAFAMAIVLCVWGGAPAFLSPILVQIIGSYGVSKVFIGEAIFFAVALLICSVFYQDAPAGFNPHPEKVAIAPSKQRNYTLSQAMRTWSFWAHFIAMGIYPGLYMCMSGLLVVYGTENGMSSTTASLIVTAVAVAQLVARFVWGPLEDKVGWRKGYLLHSIIFLLGGVVLLLAKGQPVMIFLGALLMGAGFGAVSVSNPTLALEVWGPKTSATVFGVALLGFAPGNLIVPRIGYALMNASGSYTPLIVFGMIVTFVGACCGLSIKNIKPDRFPESPEEGKNTASV
jgi:MFS family permease